MENKKVEGYIAGALFKEADQRQRKLEKEILQEKFPTVKWFNPLTDNEANDKSMIPTANSIFKGDTERIINSRYIFAELDGEDAGVMMELGVAWGINYMLTLINMAVADSHSHAELTKTILGIMNKVPFKTVVAHLTDIRTGTAGDYDGHYVPFGANQYMVGGVEEIGHIYPSVQEAIKGLQELINKEKGE